MTTEKAQKSAFLFVCEKCQNTTQKKSDYNRHILTSKHKLLTNIDEKTSENSKKYICDCGKEYNHRQSLSLHKKKCIQKIKNDDNIIIIEKKETEISPELIIDIIQQTYDGCCTTYVVHSSS
jgi:hypothetical protein